MRFDWDDPLDIARAVLGLLLGVATLASGVAFALTGHWKLLALTGAMWTFWGVFREVMDRALQPLAGWMGNLMSGGLFFPSTPFTLSIEEETVDLERLIERPLAPHREIMVGIRLAEVYRTHQRDQSKADALIARLLAKYPDAPELRFVSHPRP